MTTLTGTALAEYQRRCALVNGLRELADYLMDHLDVPVHGQYGSVSLQISALAGSDQDKAALVEQAAAALDVQIERSNGITRAARRFGPVDYFVIAHSVPVMERYREESRLGREAYAARHAGPAAVSAR